MKLKKSGLRAAFFLLKADSINVNEVIDLRRIHGVGVVDITGIVLKITLIAQAVYILAVIHTKEGSQLQLINECPTEALGHDDKDF